MVTSAPYDAGVITVNFGPAGISCPTSDLGGIRRTEGIDPAGTAVTTQAVSIPTGATASTNTSAMGTTRGLAGTAKFTNDCPPGAFLAGAAIADFTISPTPYFQFVHFEGTRTAATH